MRLMDITQENQRETGLAQNAAFIRDTYRKAVITGMLSILSVNINVFVDGILVGQRIGPAALASINLSLPVYLALCVLGSFLAAGTEIPAARAIGIGDTGKRDALFRTGLNASVLVSVIITLLGLCFRGPLVSFLCPDLSAREYVMQYVVITIIGALPKIVIYIPFWYLRLDGKNADVTLMMVGMTVINIVLDILFVYYLDMGVFGAGLASVIATALACLYGLFRLFAKGSPYTWRAELVHSRQEWLDIAASGFPSAFNNLCSTIRLLIVNSLLMAHGGAGLVAVFTAVHGIWGFGECVTLGAPAAGSAMLGVFSGERDNGSCRLLLREEWKTGCLTGGVFLVLCAVFSGAIQAMYGLSQSILIPLLWMALSVFPALLLNILTTCYNMAGMNLWSNALIFLRVIVMTWAGLCLVFAARFSVFSFLLFAELAAYFTAAVPPAEDASVEALAKQLQDEISLYPGTRAAADIVRDRGAARALVWGEKVTRMLSSLVSRYLEEGEAMLADTEIWICTACGFIYIGETPPELCPVCKVPSWSGISVSAPKTVCACSYVPRARPIQRTALLTLRNVSAAAPARKHVPARRSASSPRFIPFRRERKTRWSRQ